MKVGIMSMQRIINYGSLLQAYGLKKTIESMGDYSVEFVDYKAEAPIVKDCTETESHLVKRIKGIVKIALSPKYRKIRKYDINQNKLFSVYYNKFRSEWLKNILGITEEMNYTPQLDVLVIGSDEVFNCTQSVKEVGYSLQLFGKDNRAKRLISYAASFGSTTYKSLEDYKIKDEVCDYLSKFDCLSVRDKNSKEIVKKLTDKSAAENVDPVLVYDFEKEVTKRIDIKDYIVVYAYSGRINEKEAKAIQEFAHKNGKRTLSIGVAQSFTDEYVLADPFEMLAYIKNADYVVTDTFHGTVFSIKYQVPFATIIRESNKQKLTDLLCRFNLESRILRNIDEIESIMKKPLDKEKIKQYIRIYQEDAHSYLKNNLI